MPDPKPVLDPELVRMLVDPISKQPLELVERSGRWMLFCRANGKGYRIDPPNIPVLLADEAEG